MADAQGISYDASKAQQEALLPACRVSTPEEMAQWVDFLFSGMGEGDGSATIGDLHRSGSGCEQRILDGLSSSAITSQTIGAEPTFVP